MKHFIPAIVIGLIVGIQTLAVVHLVERDIDNYHRAKVQMMVNQ